MINHKKNTQKLYVISFILLFIAVLLSLTIGKNGSMNIWALHAEQPEIANAILIHLRLPRVLLAAIVGFGLGISGAALQGLLRNPLAEPGIIGISSGAALGAVLAFYFGLGEIFGLAVPFSGLLGSLIALILLYLLAGKRAETTYLILAGVAINIFGSALTSLALNLAPNPFAALEVVFWLMGSVANRSMEHVWLVLPFVIIGTIMIVIARRGLDALSLGEDVALTLGFSPKTLKLLIIGGSAMIVGAATSMVGMIGFIGLVVPHLMRPILGYQPSRIILPSGLIGAVLLVLADILTRFTFHGQELKVGVVTSIIGAPFFIMLLIRARHQSHAASSSEVNL
jgi:iron complex transport system permease protein